MGPYALPKATTRGIFFRNSLKFTILRDHFFPGVLLVWNVSLSDFNVQLGLLKGLCSDGCSFYSSADKEYIIL